MHFRLGPSLIFIKFNTLKARYIVRRDHQQYQANCPMQGIHIEDFYTSRVTSCVVASLAIPKKLNITYECA